MSIWNDPITRSWCYEKQQVFPWISRFFWSFRSLLDGSHISVLPILERGNFWSRKGIITQNILAVCDFNIPGGEFSAHDVLLSDGGYALSHTLSWYSIPFARLGSSNGERDLLMQGNYSFLLKKCYRTNIWNYKEALSYFNIHPYPFQVT